MDIKFGVPEKKESILSLGLKLLGILLMLLIAIGFTTFGILNLGKAVFTSYEFQTLDAIELAGGLSMLFLMSIIVLLVEIKTKVQTIGEAVVVLLKPKPTMPSSPIDFFSSLAGPDGVKGSINVIDLSKGNAGESLFQGDFSNLNELHELRNKLLTSMLNSQKEFKGRQVTKQEMLDTMTLEELEAERIKAEQDEEWIWAAAVRDKIKEKTKK